ncbi:uncharacterized protein EV420DRAFT_1326493, partial [Desarmillaria tabescens]
MIPHFGEYITIKLDPVASLQSLNDEEVTKACSVLEAKTYVACATYLFSFPLPGVDWISVGLHLVSQGLPEPGPYGFTMADMSVPIFPTTAHPLSRRSVKPGTPLPWPDCFHPSLGTARCRVKNDFTIGDPWPDSPYQLDSHDQIVLEKYFREDSERREVYAQAQGPAGAPLKESPSRTDDAGVDVDEQREPSIAPSTQDAESRYCQSEKDAPISRPKRFSSLSSLLGGLLAKALSFVPCLRADFVDDDDNASVWSSDPIFSLNIFGNSPPDTMPVVNVSDDLTSVVLPINDPWGFIYEVKALQKIEEEYHERVKAKVQADIGRARQKDEDLHARLQSKMPNRGSSPNEGDTVLPVSAAKEYVVLKLDPVASLESLNDPEATKACQALETKNYVACVTYLLSFSLPGVEYVSVNMTLLSQGLSKEHQEYLVTPDMSVPVLPNISNQLSRPPLMPTTPLPWSDCYHSTQAVATCRIRSDLTIGKPWPNPKYQLKGRELFLLSQGYCREDGDRRAAMKE